MFRKSYIAIVAFVLTSVMIFGVSAVKTDETANASIGRAENPFSFIHSARFAHVQDDTLAESKLDTVGYNLAAENTNFALYIRESNASIRILNKSTGYVWGSLSEDDPDNLNDSWTAFAASIVSIEYYDDNGNLRRTGASADEATTVFKYDKNTVICSVTFDDIDISLEAKVNLEEYGLSFSADDSSIKENGEYYIANLYFAPFLGTVEGSQIPGYMFIPDGCGALIDYKSPSEYLSGYTSRIYGRDYAIDNLYEANNLGADRPNNFLKDTESVTVPVFGAVHGVKQNAIFGIVEHGAEYAIINATPAGFMTDYNWITAGFIYRQIYQQPITKKGAGIQVVQKTPNSVNPAVSIRFLSGDNADYAGMANTYRGYLKENKLLLSNKQQDVTEIAVDFIMSDVQKGFFFSSSKTITNPDYLSYAINELKNFGVDNIRLALKGWEKGGLNGSYKNSPKTKTEFGAYMEFDKIKEITGVKLSLYSDYLRAKEPQLKEYKDAGISLSQSPIKITAEDDNLYLGDTWYLKFPQALENLVEQAEIFNTEKMGTPVIDGGNLLYGEYLSSDFVSRSSVKEILCQSFSKLSEMGNLTVFSPNDYLFKYVSEYRNISMTSSQYIYEDDTVPFLQLVLSGSMVMYAPYANDSFYSRNNILKCIEYNCYPSFLFTGIKNRELKNTALNDIGSTYFPDWIDTAAEIYEEISGILNKVKGLEMTGHSVVAEGVVSVKYGQSDYVLVNYLSENFTVGKTVIPAETAMYISNGKVGTK